MINVRFEGLDALLEQLEEMAEEIKDAALQGLKAGLSETVAWAKNAVQEDTGQLRNSIISTAERQGNEIYGKAVAGASHAVYVEMGTGPKGQASDGGKAPIGATYTTHGWVYRDPKTGNFYYTYGQPANPFMYPAYKATKDTIKDKIAEAINRAVEEG